MRWEAQTAFTEIKPGTRLCIFERMQIRGDPPGVLIGDHPLPIKDGNEKWIEAEIEGATRSRAVLKMPDGTQYEITPRGPDEFDSGITLRGMYFQDWIVRQEIAPNPPTP